MNILFALLYVENYRTIKKKSISFDHRYVCDYNNDSNSILIKENTGYKESFGKYFYGRNIYSASCFVGKNGEGKTGLVDFLRDSFALILNDMNIVSSGDGVGIYKGEPGVVELSKEKAQYYHLDENTHFFVIFQIDGEDHYLTNVDLKRIEGDVREKCRAYNPEANEKAPDYKVAYFSMMRFLDGVSKAETAYKREKDEKITISGKTALRFEHILERYNVNFSEEEMNRKRGGREGKPGVNADLFMQIAFLKNIEDKKKKTILGEDYQSRIEAANIEFLEADERGVLGIRELINDSEWSETLIQELLESPLAYFRPFSSGQYSRIAFLSRLYWYMGGGEKFWESSNMKKTLAMANTAYRDYRDQIRWLEQSQFKAESVILLIDEGELYYHPEWQRCFIRDVFDIVSEYGDKEKSADVQIVFTTSSTFMLSDILREDVVVLSEPNDEQRAYLDMNLQTYGQNIHMLLANRFFMDSTIGEESKKLITSLFDALSIRKIKEDGGTEKEEESTVVRQRVRDTVDKLFPAYVKSHKEVFSSDSGYDQFVERLIGIIGEEFYRRQLLGLFQEYKRFMLKSNDELSRKLKDVQSKLEQGSLSAADVESAIALLEQIQ
ncbi:MAG: ATP-binding protein [Lachnospiraceae bacterium]|nr:ATP-binding protein [Lachnospiraceae bacterium]